MDSVVTLYRSAQQQREVFCSVFSVSRYEWFNGNSSGVSPQYLVKMPSTNYQGEKIAIYDAERYGIYRTYSEGDMVELYLTKTNVQSLETVTLYFQGTDSTHPRMVHLADCSFEMIRGSGIAETGLLNNGSIKLHIPVSSQAKDAITGVSKTFLKPKAYKASQSQSNYWTIDSEGNQCFFALGALTEQNKFQVINEKYDDVFRIITVSVPPMTTEGAFIEVIGK